MKQDRLTKYQLQIVKELEDTSKILALQYSEILNVKREDRTAYLRRCIDQQIRGRIVMWYTLVDYQLDAIILNHLFIRQAPKNRPFWYAQKAKNFKFQILERIFLLTKLDYVICFRPSLKKFEGSIRALNDLRNGLAHSFKPKTRYKQRPIYKGKNIYTQQGLRFFEDEMEEIEKGLARANSRF